MKANFRHKRHFLIVASAMLLLAISGSQALAADTATFEYYGFNANARCTVQDQSSCEGYFQQGKSHSGFPPTSSRLDSSLAVATVKANY